MAAQRILLIQGQDCRLIEAFGVRINRASVTAGVASTALRRS